MNRSAISRNNNIYGSNAQAVLHQGSSVGLTTAFLYKDATVSLWRFRFARITPFIMDTKWQYLNVTNGADNTIVRYGDLLHWNHLQVEVPAIYAVNTKQNAVAACDLCEETEKAFFGQYAAQRNMTNVDDIVQAGYEAWMKDQYGAIPSPLAKQAAVEQESVDFVHWIDCLGFYLNKSISFKLLNNSIGELYPDYLFALEELAGTCGKRLRAEIGRYDTEAELINASCRNQILSVPLPYPHHVIPGNALSSTTLSACPFNLAIQPEAIENLIRKSSPSVVAYNANTNEPVKATDIKMAFVGTWIHLDPQERVFYHNAEYDTLWTTVKVLYGTNNRSGQIVVNAKAANDVIEYIWMAKRECHARNNLHSNYSGIAGEEPLVDCTLRYNGDVRISAPASFFRTVTARQHHSLVPESFIYCYSFAENTEDPQPSGSSNQANVNTVTLEVTLQKGLENEVVDLVVFVRAYNILRYLRNVGGLVFAY